MGAPSVKDNIKKENSQKPSQKSGRAGGGGGGGGAEEPLLQNHSV